MENKTKILYLVHLPPPIHGVSLFNKNVIESVRINSSVNSQIIKINYNKSIDQVNKFNLSKVSKYLNLFLKLFSTPKSLIGVISFSL